MSGAALQGNRPGVPIWRASLPAILRTHGAILALAALVLVNLAVTPHYATADNLWNVLLQVSTLVPVAIGMTLVLVTGGVDLSVGSIMAVSSAVAAATITRGAGAAMLAGLLVGVGLGAVNDLLVARSGIPPFIATLALLITGRGLAQVISNEGELVPFTDPAFQWLGRGYVGTVPVQVVIAAVVFGVTLFATRATSLGRYLVAVGSNEVAARLAGVPVVRTKLAAYMLSGLLTGIAGLIETARLGATDPSNLGSGMEFNASPPRRSAARRSPAGGSPWEVRSSAP